MTDNKDIGMSVNKKKSKIVEPIEITEDMRKEELPTVIKVFELTNELMEKKLCGFNVTLTNGWTVSFKNNRFAKQIGVPM